MINLGQLSVIKNGKIVSETKYNSADFWEATKDIKSANYGVVGTITTHYIRINGIEDMNCKLQGNKTNIEMKDEHGINRYYGCIVTKTNKNGYELSYEKVEKVYNL